MKLGTQQIILCVLLICCVPAELPAVDPNVTAQLVEVVPARRVIRRIRTASEVPGGELLAVKPDAPLRFWVDHIHLGSDNAYSEESIRYLALRLTVVNQAQEELSLAASQITLHAWNETYKLNERPPEFDQTPVKVERDIFAMTQLITPNEVLVPPQRAASFWCVFTQLTDRPGVEELQLHIPLASGEILEHDLRREQRARLGLTSTRIGPENSLGLLTIHGAANTINAQDLADELQRLARQQTRRVVLEWSEQATAMDPDIVDWLMSRSEKNAVGPLHANFPHLPEFFFLGLTQLPQENLDDGYVIAEEEALYAESASAVRAALAELFAAIAPHYLLREIRQGHPLSQRAALAALEFRQDSATFENLFTQLSQLYDTADASTRTDVLLAIGQQSDPAALEMLTKISSQGSSAEAEAALRALLRSNHPQGVEHVVKLMQAGEINLPISRQIELLTQHFRRPWLPFLSNALAHDQAAVRKAAVEAFVTVGHPDLLNLLSAALEDSAADVRDAAFAALSTRGDARSEQLAMNYALEQLSAGKLSDAVVALISRTRDQRAAPLVVKGLLAPQANGEARAEESQRFRKLALLEHVGDERSIRELLVHEERFSPRERMQLYQLAMTFNLPEQLEVAIRALHSPEDELRQSGISLLTMQVSDAAAEALAEFLPKAQPAEMTQICYALGRIGTVRAEQLLKNFRQAAHAQQEFDQLQAASTGLRIWMAHSPGWNALESAFYHSRVENYENALTYFELAAEIDPELGIAYSSMGNSLLKLDRVDEAGAAFQRAYDLDDFDGQAVTGIGIVKAMQGEVEDAVRLTVDSTSKFPNDNIFAYNTACVYGRAVEFLKKQGEAADQSLIRRYEQQAIEALQRSIEYGFDEWDLMRTDPDLHALRDLPSFQQLLKRN